jgi:hypothetical protein
MSDPILTVVDIKDTPDRKAWVQNFNQYRASNSFIDAAQLIWNDWNTQGNVFLELLPTPEALLFSLLTYVPERVDLPIISAPPTPIKWDDTPIYDTFSNYWDGVYTWNCADWQAWHVALETHFGSTSTANGLWKSAWLHDDNYCIVLGSFGCPKTSNCRYNCDFVKYFASKDMEIGNVFSNGYCDLTSIVLNIIETVDNVTQGVNNTTKTVSNLLPWAAGAGILYGGVKIYKAF